MPDGTYNFRDVGGMPAGAGIVRRRVLYRSDALCGLTGAGVEMLARSPIGTVVDLRSREEAEENPDLLPKTRPIDLVALPLLEGAAWDAAAAATTLDELYAAMAATTGPAVAQLGRVVAEERDGLAAGVLVHCAAGKDRTGFAVALLLAAVGADRDAVIADYAASERHLAGEWADLAFGRARAYGALLTPDLRALIAHSPAEAIAGVLSAIDSGFGDPAEYLRAHGLAQSELVALCARLVQTDEPLPT